MARKFAIVTCTSDEDRKLDLKQAIVTKDIYALLQVYAEGVDFTEPLPDMVSSLYTLYMGCLCISYLNFRLMIIY